MSHPLPLSLVVPKKLANWYLFHRPAGFNMDLEQFASLVAGASRNLPSNKDRKKKINELLNHLILMKSAKEVPSAGDSGAL